MSLKDITRAWAFGLTALLTFAGVGYASPEQLPVLTYKIGLVTLGGFVGYWLDRHLFPYARPHTFDGSADYPIFAASMIRRAIIVAATVLGFALAI